MALHWASGRSSNSANWWIGTLFAIGSLCFLVGPFPGFIDLIGSAADGTVFFVGSIFFTSAAFLQFRHSENKDRIATAIQLVGTVFFNINTFRAVQDSYDSSDVNRLIWTPDAIGSACFLISGFLAYMAVRRLRSEDRTEWRIAVINLVGCVLFGVSAIASYVVPATGDAIDLAAANWSTSLGALCFLIGALMLLPSRSPKT
jgi:hypothetical protein